MVEDYSKEVKELIKANIKNGFEYGKSEKYLSYRVGATKGEIEKEIADCQNLTYTDKRNIDGEIRYTLYFVYNKRKGKVYSITFREKIRIITTFPLGKRTIKKYFKKRFKK